MINFHELLILYLISFVVTFLGFSLYYFFYVRRPVKMLLLALHASRFTREFPPEMQAPQGRFFPLGRELNAFVKWAEAMGRDDDESRIRREVSTDISHDFRIPLTSIQGYAERLLAKGYSLPEEEAARHLQVILSNTRLLNELVTNLLELSRLEGTATPLNPGRFSAREFAEDVHSKFKFIAEEKGLRFSLEVAPLLPELEADRFLIERALSNILENAIYYTPAGGAVALIFRKAARGVQVEVRDTGVGIPADALPRVFDRFFRVNKDRSHETGGAGLGLSIAKAVMEAHGSSLSIQSALGNGTSVTFLVSA